MWGRKITLSLIWFDFSASHFSAARCAAAWLHLFLKGYQSVRLD
jgi:hypothetical protein